MGNIQASGTKFAKTDSALLALAPLWKLWSTQLARGWTSAVSSPNFIRIAEINVAFIALGGVRIQRMASSAFSHNLKRLQFQFCGLGDQGGLALAQSPYLRHLDMLGLGSNELTDVAIIALKDACFAPALRELQLGGNQVSPDGVQALASGTFAGLVELDLSGSKFGDLGIRALTSGSVFYRLRYLRLRYVSMSDAGFAELAGWPGLTGVRSLDISGNQLTAASLPLLLTSPHLEGVRECQIDLLETPLEQDARARAALRERFNHVVFDPALRG